MLDLKGHGIEYCNQCGITVVICKNCGNNTCNGGYGKLKDGIECPDCKEAYEIFLNKDFDHANSP